MRPAADSQYASARAEPRSPVRGSVRTPGARRPLAARPRPVRVAAGERLLPRSRGSTARSGIRPAALRELWPQPPRGLQEGDRIFNPGNPFRGRVDRVFRTANGDPWLIVGHGMPVEGPWIPDQGW
jgi:hypothetical protein